MNLLSHAFLKWQAMLWYALGMTDRACRTYDRLLEQWPNDAKALAARTHLHAQDKRLSLARAQSVSDYLTSRHAIDAARLTPEGKGASEPMNKAVPAAPENRRVTIVAQPVS